MSQMLDPRHPLLVVVRGKPGAGKTTLARRLAETERIGLPLLSRDALKTGLIERHGDETDAVRARVVPLAFDLFHRTIEQWLRAGVSLIADEAFSRDRSEAELRDLARLARLVIIHCITTDDEARRRYVAREQANPRKRLDVLAATVERMARGDYPWAIFAPLDLGVPSLSVDTTYGYEPGLEAIVAFCRAGRAERDGRREAPEETA